MKLRPTRWLLPILGVALLVSSTQTCYAETHKPSKKLWLVSVAALVAANVFDVHSSLGRSEANTLLRDAQGRFNPQRGLLIKSSASGGSLLLQVLLFRIRGGEDLYKPAAIANFGCAGAIGSIALHNARISTPRATPDYLQPR